ncbi:MAG TPA: hypothetical protein VN934_05755 [Candidatus Tumulicola sp.]|nr:hypothetical protein [Candidatus Tumulicola sp.]
MELPKDIAEMLSAMNQGPEISVPVTYPRAYPMFERWDSADRRAEVSASDRRSALSEIEKRRRRILYAIIQHIEKWKGRIVAVDWYRFKVEIGADELAFTLREPSNRVQRPLTQQELRWYPDRDSMPDLQASGRLRLLLEESFDRPIQKSWGDLAGKPLETRLHEVLSGLLIALSESRRRRLHWEDWHRQRAVDEQERVAAQERRRIEQERIQKLVAESAAWTQARQIRDYVKAALSAALARGGKADDKLAVWSDWAMDIAARMDPLTR